jgi:hypothetical protein
MSSLILSSVDVKNAYSIIFMCLVFRKAQRQFCVFSYFVCVLYCTFVKLHGRQQLGLSFLNFSDASRVYLKARRSMQMTSSSYTLYLSHSVACTLSQIHTPTLKVLQVKAHRAKSRVKETCKQRTTLLKHVAREFRSLVYVSRYCCCNKAL